MQVVAAPSYTFESPLLAQCLSPQKALYHLSPTEVDWRMKMMISTILNDGNDGSNDNENGPKKSSIDICRI